MAQIDLTMILEKQLWTDNTIINSSSELTELFDSGILYRNAQLDAKLKHNDVGERILIPYLNELGYVQPAYPTCGTNPTPTCLDTKKGEATAIISRQSICVSECTLAEQLDSGVSIIEYIISFFGRYWTLDIQNRISSMAKGILASNIANNAGDLLVDDSANVFNYAKLIDARALRGDAGFNSGTLDFAFMHSSTFSAILKEDERRVRAIENANGMHLYWLLDESYICKIDDIMPFDGTNATILFAN